MSIKVCCTAQVGNELVTKETEENFSIGRIIMGKGEKRIFLNILLKVKFITFSLCSHFANPLVS